jgi:hypothetical protein
VKLAAAIPSVQVSLLLRVKYIYIRRIANNADLVQVDKHELYEKAVQSPAGDISYLKRFYRAYVGLRVRGVRVSLACDHLQSY